MPVRASISTTSADAKMPSLPRMWPRIVRPPDDSPPSTALCSTIAGDDVLEPDRDFVAFLAQVMRQAVEQVGGRQVAHHAAALAAHFVHVPIEQQQDVVDGDVLAEFIHNRDAVGIAVHRQADVVAAFVHGRSQQPQRFRIGRGRASAEQADCGARG